MSYVLISNAVLLSVFLGIISISLEMTVNRQSFVDSQESVVLYFRRLFPGNKKKIKQFFNSFLALDIGCDGVVSSSELAFAYSIVTGIEIGPRVTVMITRWMKEIDQDEMGDGQISLHEYMQFMVLKHIEKGRFKVRKTMTARDGNMRKAMRQDSIRHHKLELLASERSVSQIKAKSDMEIHNPAPVEQQPAVQSHPGDEVVRWTSSPLPPEVDGGQRVVSKKAPLAMGTIERAMDSLESEGNIGRFFEEKQPDALNEHFKEMWKNRLSEPADVESGQIHV
jgi:hypothetical protein